MNDSRTFVKTSESSGPSSAGSFPPPRDAKAILNESGAVDSDQGM